MINIEFEKYISKQEIDHRSFHSKRNAKAFIALL